MQHRTRSLWLAATSAAVARVSLALQASETGGLGVRKFFIAKARPPPPRWQRLGAPSFVPHFFERTVGWGLFMRCTGTWRGEGVKVHSTHARRGVSQVVTRETISVLTRTHTLPCASLTRARARACMRVQVSAELFMMVMPGMVRLGAKLAAPELQ